MAIDKSLYAAPQGLGALNEDPISVEIEDPEAVHISGPGFEMHMGCLLYTSPSPRDGLLSRMPSSA